MGRAVIYGALVLVFVGCGVQNDEILSRDDSSENTLVDQRDSTSDSVQEELGEAGDTAAEGPMQSGENEEDGFDSGEESGGVLGGETLGDTGSDGSESSGEESGEEEGMQKTQDSGTPLDPDNAPKGDEFTFTPFEARDPELVIDNGIGYLYTTNIFPFGPPINVPIWKTTDFSAWEAVGDGLEKVGSWAEDSWTWAPGVINASNKWILFYTARVLGTTADSAYPAGVQCVGLAVAPAPTGPFIDRGSDPFICQESLGGSIDPSPFRDDDGSLWIAWKADTNAPHINGTACIFSQRLNTSAMRLLGESTNLLCRDQDWEWPLIENPDFFRDSDGDLWLSYSAGWWDSASYSTGIASCASPSGPCVKEGQWLSSGDGLVGPGGVTFVSDGEDDYVVVCTWEGGAGFDEGGTGVTGVVQMARVLEHIQTERRATTTLDGSCYTAPPDFVDMSEGLVAGEWNPQQVRSVAALPSLSLEITRRVGPVEITTTTTTMVSRVQPLMPVLTTTTTTTMVSRVQPLMPVLTTTTTTTPWGWLAPGLGRR